jgi:hypothetical protein
MKKLVTGWCHARGAWNSATLIGERWCLGERHLDLFQLCICGALEYPEVTKRLWIG